MKLRISFESHWVDRPGSMDGFAGLTGTLQGTGPAELRMTRWRRIFVTLVAVGLMGYFLLSLSTALSNPDFRTAPFFTLPLAAIGVWAALRAHRGVVHLDSEGLRVRGALGRWRTCLWTDVVSVRCRSPYRRRRQLNRAVIETAVDGERRRLRLSSFWTDWCAIAIALAHLVRARPVLADERTHHLLEHWLRVPSARQP